MRNSKKRRAPPPPLKFGPETEYSQFTLHKPLDQSHDDSPTNASEAQ